MNTPRKKRRWASEIISLLWTSKVRDGTVTLGIHSGEAAAIFAAVVSEFVYLEQAMELVLSRLLGADNNAASHISRQILSPSVRVDMMRALLERAPHNKDKPDYFDEIINEFKEISTLRNHYVHGKWETGEDGKQLYLVRPGDDPYALGSLITEEFDLAEMQSTRKRIMELWTRIYKEIGAESPIAHQK
jgi:hypothetical protein